MRFAAVAGGSALPADVERGPAPANNPVIDDHILGAITVVVLALTNAGDTWGLGRWWTKTEAVERYPALR